MRLLIIEDNPKMAAALRRGLTDNGYVVDVTHQGSDGEQMAASTAYDAVVLDLMLPDCDGIEVCRSLRARGIGVPVLMLTALGTTEDKVTGLDCGADDYLTKPFEFAELLARLRVITRRADPKSSRTIRYADIELDLYSHEAVREGHKVTLSNKEFALLEFFIRNPGQDLTRATLYEKVWGMAFEPETNVIDVYISALRRKLEREGLPQLVHTLKGLGYRFGSMPQVGGEL